MAKGKQLNPADAYRKAQRRKELKKNKAKRAKARDFALVKKDTRDLEDEIETLEANTELSATDKARLSSLKIDLSKIMEKKEEYVREHPEQRRLVYRPRKQEKGEDQEAPERRSDEDIVMPDGPPPGASLEEDSESNSDDDIPMPEGPPPNTISNQNDQAPPVPPFPPHILSGSPLFMLPPPPPPPSSWGGIYTSLPGTIPPPPPPGFFPRRIQSTSSIQDPLSSIPHQTYQAQRTTQLPLWQPSLPPKPIGGPGSVSAGAVHTGAIVSAEPELRDLKKEATTFVPASLRRKKPSGVPSSSKINAAPSVSVSSEATSTQTRPDLVDVLKSQLGTGTAPPLTVQVTDKGTKTRPVKDRDDYQKFVDEMGDFLGPPRSF